MASVFEWFEITNVTFDKIGTLEFTENAEQIYPIQRPDIGFWRFISSHDSLTKSDIEQMAIINSSNNLELKFIDKPKTSSLTNNSGLGLILNYFSGQQYAWNWHVLESLSHTYKYEFTFKRPDNDALIFTFGPSAFDSKNSNYGYQITALTLYFKNNRFYLYLAQTRTDLGGVTPPYVFISQINNSDVSAGTYHTFRLEQNYPFGGTDITVYFDDVKVISLIAEDSDGPGNPDKYNYKLNGDKANPIYYYDRWSKTIKSENDNDSTTVFPFFYWGTSPYSLSWYSANTWNYNDWGYTLSLNVNVMDTIGDASSPRRTDYISYIKDPLPAQNNLNLSFPLNPGNKIELKNIKISAKILKTDFEYNFPISIDVKNTEEFTKDLFPINIEVPLNEYKEDLFTITVPVKDDFSASLLDPINIEVQLDKSETDLFNITLDVDAPVYQLELGPEFVSGWDDRKYLVFRNGHLLPKQTYNIIIPSHHNNYLKKILYSTVGFSKGDRIEVFYIENQENFANVPFNRETRVASYIYYAKSNNQKLIKIPYPNSSYRRSKDSFYLFNDKGEHLDCRFDYTVSADGRYVTLADHAKLKVMMLDYVVFTFCYIQNRSIDGQEQETDMFDTVNLAEIEYEYSYSVENIDDTSGTVVFSPPFDKWTNNTKENFMLFGNSVYIDPERYEIIDNSTIQFVDPEEAEVANSRRYTMCIPVHQTKLALSADTQIHYEVVRVIATKDKQSVFTLELPDNSTYWYPFLLFKGSILLDVYDQYEFEDTTGILTITDPECYVSEGRALTIVYLNKSYTDIKKEIKYVKMEFNVTPTGMTEIPLYLYRNKDIKFNSSNLLLFVNGVFIEPERYTIEPDNWIKFNSIPEIAGYDEPYEDKSFTGIYIMAYEDPDSNSDGFDDLYGQKEVDPSEDNDKTRFDELYSRVERKPE